MYFVCLIIADAKTADTNKVLIAGICVSVILVVCAVIGLVIYRKCSDYPNPRPFWTVELQSDRDSVNFSSVPEDELAFQNDERDMNFYERQGAQKSHKGSQKYTALQEEA